MTRENMKSLLRSIALNRHRQFFIGDAIRDVMLSDAYLDWLEPLLPLASQPPPGDERFFFTAYTTPHSFMAGTQLVRAFAAFINADPRSQER